MLKKRLEKFSAGLHIYITKKEAQIYKLKAGTIIEINKSNNKH